MIAYEVLVQTIADWKAGARPTAPTPPPAGTPEAFEELASGVVDFDDADLGDEVEVTSDEEAEDYEVAYGEDEGGYAEADAGGYPTQEPAQDHVGSGEYQAGAEQGEYSGSGEYPSSGEYQAGGEYSGSGEYQGGGEYESSGEYHEAPADPTAQAYIDDDDEEPQT
jgi:hypothetical protein